MQLYYNINNEIGPNILHTRAQYLHSTKISQYLLTIFTYDIDHDQFKYLSYPHHIKITSQYLWPVCQTRTSRCSRYQYQTKISLYLPYSYHTKCSQYSFIIFKFYKNITIPAPKTFTARNITIINIYTNIKQNSQFTYLPYRYHTTVSRYLWYYLWAKDVQNRTT